jgi:hypothetical protein
MRFPANSEQAPWVRSTAVILLGALAFLALAMFSPLHQHASDGSCSLNDFEQVVVGHAEYVIPALQLSLLAWHEPIIHERPATRFSDATLFQRGPPPVL